jgi:hypothetical protein
MLEYQIASFSVFAHFDGSEMSVSGRFLPLIDTI